MVRTAREAGLERRATDNRFEFSVATAPSTARHRRLALIVVAATVVAYVAAAPFLAVQLPRVDSYIPTVFSAIFVADLVVAVLLYSQFAATGWPPLLVLASGYLFSSLIVVAHMLTYPGAFSSTGLLGAGPQSAAWLNFSWRVGLGAAMAAYAVLRASKKAKDAGSPQAAIFCSVAIVAGSVCALTYVATAGREFLPPLVSGIAVLPAGQFINGFIALTSLAALVLLLVLARGRSILDLWLMVAAFALLAEGIMATFVPARFTLGFYAVRIISLPVSKVVLVVLLWETMRLYTELAISNRQLQRERAGRLTDAATVAAAIAHEVRQPLTGINLLAYAGQQLLDRSSPDVGEGKKFFGEIKDAAFRANEVFDGFLKLFRGGRQGVQSVDVNALALEAVELLRKSLNEHSVITTTKLASDLPVIQGHPGQLRAVILNLIENSIDAMSGMTDRPRVISIETARRGAGAIAISLQDTGPGIEPEMLAAIFDPFFTTKAKGTGLGLAICKMIVDQHGGKLTAASGKEGGARFEIVLPLRVIASAALAQQKRLETAG